jgi:hypothetical protein
VSALDVNVDDSKWLSVVLLLLGVFGGLLPIAAHWLVLERVPSATTREARSLLGSRPNEVVLVDVMPESHFRSRHLKDAVNWPYEQIKTLEHEGDIPARFRERQLLLVCDSGIL